MVYSKKKVKRKDTPSSPLFLQQPYGSENMLHAEKAEKIRREDREYVRSDLSSLAEWIRERYPTMNYGEVNRFLHEMLEVSV
jgi:AAA+ ATPase superfamily predicted ATPase